MSQAQSGGEAMLDFTIAYALTYPQTIEYFSVDNSERHKNGFLDTLLDSMDGSFCTYSVRFANPILILRPEADTSLGIRSEG